MNIESKQKLIDWLFSLIGAHRHFDMDVIANTNSCNTTLCLLGAAGVFARHGTIPKAVLYEAHPDYSELFPDYLSDEDYLNYDALQWLGFNVDNGWIDYSDNSLFFKPYWPELHQRIYDGNSRLFQHIDTNWPELYPAVYKPAGHEDGHNKQFEELVAGILLLTDLPETFNGDFDHEWFDQNEFYCYDRHRDLIHSCCLKAAHSC